MGRVGVGSNKLGRTLSEDATSRVLNFKLFLSGLVALKKSHGLNILQLTYDKKKIYYTVSNAHVILSVRVLSMLRSISQLPAPSKTDLEILAVLWDQPGATGRAIYDALLDTGRLRRRIAYTTIKTYLDRLVQKGYIEVNP